MFRKAGTPVVIDSGDFDDGGSDTEPLAGRKIIGAKIKVDEEVITG